MFLFKKKNMYVDENGAYNPPGQHMIILNDSLTLLCIVLFPFVVLSGSSGVMVGKKCPQPQCLC